jgi:inositol-1,4,5-trisphosphate 5-phosphatase
VAGIQLLCLTIYRFENDRYEKVPFFMFGDYNFRLDTHQLVKVGN